MNEKSNKRMVLVGLFVFIGLLFLVAGILVVGNLHETFQRKMRVVALFNDVEGLQAGNNIWFSGVKIGTVSSIQFYERSKVKVILRIETASQKYIRKDAKVKISTDGLIGNKILVIYGGTLHSGIIEEEDTLKVESTFSSEDVMNTLQANNRNLLSITTDIKSISAGLANGKGTAGRLLQDSSLYINFNETAALLHHASLKANLMMESLAEFSRSLNKEGTFAHELVSDTVIMQRIRASAVNLKSITDTASLFVSRLNEASRNKESAAGVLLYDKETGVHLKSMLANLDSGSVKLDEDLKALQQNFLLRRYFRKKDKK
jgi:phospholipid/cholesterol/gamma-HCH transport system substrate-binding protein